MGDHACTRTPLHSGSVTPIRGVPVLPPAGDPRPQYPLHAALLDAHLVGSGEDPALWTLQAAIETGLDEHGMEVRFDLLRRGPGRRMITRWVTVKGGKLVAVRDRADPG